jgi:hypothetical protein
LNRIVSAYPDAPCPSEEDFGLSPDRGFVSVNIYPRHRPGERLLLALDLLDTASSHESDRTVVLELDAGGEVVDRAAKAVGRLTQRMPFEIWVRLPRRQPARYVARLEIHQPDAPPRVFEWPVEVPDPTLPLAATLSLSATTAAPGDKLKLTAHNTGPTPLWLGETYYLQRWREDGTGWEDVNRDDYDLRHLIELPPGGSHTRRVDVPRRARPGRHRIVKEFDSPWAHGTVRASWAHETVRASVEFDIVARASH